MTILGLDVGVDQGILGLADWRTMKQQGRRFVFIRGMEGLTDHDVRFAPNVAGSQAAGFASGVYNVGHPWLDAAEQAQTHYDASGGLGTRKGELAPALDLELPEVNLWAAKGLSGETILAWAGSYVKTASLLWRRPISVYIYEWWWQQVLKTGGDPGALSETSLWLALYQGSPPKPLAPWSSVTFWQDSGGKAYHTPEHEPCDSDTFLGSEEDFATACDPSALVVTPLSPDESPS